MCCSRAKYAGAAPGVCCGGVVSECVVPEPSMLGRLQVLVAGVWFLSVLFQEKRAVSGRKGEEGVIVAESVSTYLLPNNHECSFRAENIRAAPAS